MPARVRGGDASPDGLCNNGRRLNGAIGESFLLFFTVSDCAPGTTGDVESRP